MKKKLLSLVLTAAIAVTLLTGCSLFTSGNGNDSNSSEFPAVEITDSFSFTNPADVEFDARYVLYFDENSTVVSGQADEYGMLAYYVILYAKEEQPVARYEFYVCDTAENAESWLADENYTTSGREVKIVDTDATVMQSLTTADGIEELEAQIMLCEAAGIISEATVSAYADFTVTTGATLID